VVPLWNSTAPATPCALLAQAVHVTIGTKSLAPDRVFMMAHPYPNSIQHANDRAVQHGLPGPQLPQHLDTGRRERRAGESPVSPDGRV
jgi:hypothetical protein